MIFCEHGQKGGEQFCVMCLRKICDARALLIAEMATVLLAIEWSGTEEYDTGPACPSCRTPMGLSHDPGCVLDAALKKAGVR